ncbi:hypothetical protein IJ750_07290 [bacterium]|nr:hypothetical protein [bacterium]
MQVQRINNCNLKTNFQGINKFCRYGIGAFIASTSLFMLSNAFDSFSKEAPEYSYTAPLDKAASALGIAGTLLSLFGIRQEDANDEH